MTSQFLRRQLANASREPLPVPDETLVEPVTSEPAVSDPMTTARAAMESTVFKAITHRTLVLRAACSIPTETFSKSDLVVVCFERNPNEFGFTESNGKRHPNSNAVYPRIDGSTGLVALGMLDWISPGILTVTDRGQRAGRKPEPEKPFTRAKPGRKPKPVVIVDCEWCGQPATCKDSDGDDACRSCKSELAARKAKKRREAERAAKALNELLAPASQRQPEHTGHCPAIEESTAECTCGARRKFEES